MIWAETGPAVRPEMRGLPDVTAAAIVNSREVWPRRKIAVGLSSASPGRAADSPCRYCFLAWLRVAVAAGPERAPGEGLGCRAGFAAPGTGGLTVSHCRASADRSGPWATLTRWRRCSFPTPAPTTRRSSSGCAPTWKLRGSRSGGTGRRWKAVAAISCRNCRRRSRVASG